MGQAIDKERLIELLEPALAALGFELADLDAHAAAAACCESSSTAHRA